MRQRWRLRIPICGPDWLHMNSEEELSAIPTPPIDDAAAEAQAENLLGEEASRSLKEENRKVLILIGVVATFMLVAQFTPLRAWITNVQVWKGYIRDLGWVAHGVFAAVCAGGVMLGIPRLPLCGAAGLIFGFGEGTLLSLVGSTFGSYGAFLMARHGARRAVASRAARWPWLNKLLEKPSIMRVVWVRQLMVPGIVLNVLLGVSAVRHRIFLVGTALGYLPLNLAFSLVGSGMGKENLLVTMTQLLGAIGAVNLVAWFVWRNRRRS